MKYLVWDKHRYNFLSCPLSGFYLSPLSLNAFFNSPLNFWWDCPGRTGEWGSSKASKIPHIFSIVFYSNCSPPRQPPRVYKKILYSSSNLIGNLKEFLRVDFQKYRLEQSLLISQIKVKFFVTFQTTAIPYLMQDSFFCKLIINIVMHIFCTK